MSAAVERCEDSPQEAKLAQTEEAEPMEDVAPVLAEEADAALTTGVELAEPATEIQMPVAANLAESLQEEAAPVSMDDDQPEPLREGQQPESSEEAESEASIPEAADDAEPSPKAPGLTATESTASLDEDAIPAIPEEANAAPVEETA